MVFFQELAEKLAEDENISKTRLRQALRHYTSSWRYLKSIKKDSYRIDLAGENVEQIDQDQADHASKTLKESQEKFANKKAQDNPEKTSYKKKQGDNVKGKTDHKRNKKFKSVKTPTKSAPKTKTPLKPVESATIKVNQKVKVQLANAPMNATITEIAGNDISVQLDSGMVVKTRIDNIFSE